MARPMTRRGYDAIQAEMTRLWHEERPMVVAEVSAAADLGDRSENAAYIYGKKRLRAIDSRLRYLKRKVDGVTVVDTDTQLARDHVAFGAIVVLEAEDGEQKRYRLVDKDESEPGLGRISIQSPIGQALLKKQEGDEVTVKTPAGSRFYEIVEILYGPGDP